MYVGHTLCCLQYISVHASGLIIPFLFAAIRRECVLVIGFQSLEGITLHAVTCSVRPYWQ